MIRLKRLNGFEFVLNSDLIKIIETTPDTMITLTSGEKLLVKETVDEVVEKATLFWKRVHQEPPSLKGRDPA
jgi:flagellar protein FlbD